MLIGILSGFGVSHAQEPQDITDQKQIYIYVQIYVRDSAGNLVTYITSDRFTDINYNALDVFLNHEALVGSATVYDIGDKKFQLIQRSKSVQPEGFGFVASTVLDIIDNAGSVSLARFANDGYYVMSGDKVTQVWTFFRQLT